MNLADENFKKLAALFPNAITETINEAGETVQAIDFDILRQEIGAAIDDKAQRYQFTWPDKHKSLRLANSPTDKTLRLDRDKSTGRDGTPRNINTENIYIEGDNLDALKILRETYLGKVKMIYIDPPYNTGNDFIYNDDFTISADEYDEQSGQYDNETGARLVQNLESNGRFHTDWLNMIYPRLKLARDFLSDDGVIFISIDDNEQHNLRKVCDEIFGSRNFVAELIWKSKSGGANDSKFFAVDHEYIIVYAKDIDKLTINQDSEATVTTSYNRKDDQGEYSLDRLDKQSIRYSQSLDYEIIGPDGLSYFPHHKDPEHPNATWRWSKDRVAQHYNELVFENGNVYTKNYKKSGAIARSLMIEERFGRTRTGKTDFYELFSRDYFSAPKPYKLVQFLLNLATKPDSLVLDFFSGSATTAHAVMALNNADGGKRKFILVQLPEVTGESSEARKAGFNTICDIGEERIRRAGKKIREESPLTTGELDIGFRVFRVDSSNMKDVYKTPAEYSQETLDLFIENIKPDRTPEDLLIQVMLELGIELSAKIEEEFVAGKHVFIVEDGYLIACFDERINNFTVTEIAKRQPVYVAFRDSCFENDSVMTNFDQLIQAYSPKTRWKIL